MTTEAIRIGSVVRVIGADDRETYDVSEHIGRVGIVRAEVDHPAPFTVELTTRQRESFWLEELEVVK